MVATLLRRLKRAQLNNRLLLRSYFAIIFGIAALALLLDLAFYPASKALDNRPEHQALYQLASTLAERQLAAGDGDSEQVIGRYSLRIWPRQTVHTEQLPPASRPYTLASNQRGLIYLNWPSRDGLHWIQFGPLEPQPAQTDWPTWIFYASLFVLVSLWLRPLLKDLDRVSRAVDDFRNDYRAPLPQLKDSSDLKPLASNIATMAAKIRQLIDTQKDLSSVLSHEMRTPLSRIKFSLALLRGQAQLNASQERELSGIDQDINELQQLTQAMLEFAKLDHPDMAIQPQPMDARRWLEAYVEKQQPHCRPLRLHCSINGQPKQPIVADPHWLELALSNLVTNAVRYAKTEIAVRLRVTADGFQLTVADDGPGIAPDELPRVLKPFYQPADEPSKGFGLGLALVQRIAQLHRGQVSVGRADLGGAEITLSVSPADASDSTAIP